jgi:asparagine synthase (glutamine-hydrolysing)
MCGLVGIVEASGQAGGAAGASYGEDAAAAIQAQRLRRMAASLAHRGPDGEGYFTDAGPGLQLRLGHRRLAIFDPSPAAAQPMTDGTGRYTIAFNGAIYNYVELLAELGLPPGRSDTAALLAAWAAHGPGCLGRCNGMFAFALWDAAERALYLCRDRFGEKPLYYGVPAQGGLVFASEVKALFASGLVTAQPDRQMLAEFLATRDVDHHAERTMYVGVAQVPPGCYLQLQAGRGAPRPVCIRYYDLAPPVTRRPLDDALVEETRALLDDAVRLRLRGDARLGGSLSGGLDSSLLTALAWPRAPAYRVFISEFRDAAEPGDESSWAEQVVRGLGLPADQVVRSRPRAGDFAADLEKVVYHQEAPFADTSVCAHFALMRAVAGSGVRVLLSGQGGDEVFGGYGSYYYALLAALLRAGRTSELLAELRARLGLFADRPLRLMAGALYHALPPALRQIVYARRVRAEFPLSPLAEQLWRAAPPRFLATLPELCQAQAGDWPRFDAYLLDSVARYALPHILRHDDRNSMAFGIESRAPYLDHRLLELALRTDPRARIGDGYTKRLLRAVARGRLPEPVRLRVDKRGFFSPQRDWLLGNRELVHGYLATPPDGLRELCDQAALARILAGFYQTGDAAAGATLWAGLVASVWLRTVPRLGRLD